MKDELYPIKNPASIDIEQRILKHYCIKSRKKDKPINSKPAPAELNSGTQPTRRPQPRPRNQFRSR